MLIYLQKNMIDCMLIEIENKLNAQKTWYVSTQKIFHLSNISESTCNYPTDLQNGVWDDSQKSSITYTTTTMTGYTYSSYSSGSSVWDCHLIEGDFVVSKYIIKFFYLPQNKSFGVFSSTELKRQVSFFDHIFPASVCNLCTF